MEKTGVVSVSLFYLQAPAITKVERKGEMKGVAGSLGSKLALSYKERHAIGHDMQYYPIQQLIQNIPNSFVGVGSSPCHQSNPRSSNKNVS